MDWDDTAVDAESSAPGTDELRGASGAEEPADADEDEEYLRAAEEPARDSVSAEESPPADSGEDEK